MAHTFGKKSTRTSSASSPITTASFTIVSGETVLVLMLKTVGSVDRAGGAPTFNGVTMTQANSTQKAATSPEAGAELWYLLNPPVGAFTCSIPNTGLKTIFYTLATGIAGAGKHSVLDGANGGNNTSTNPTPGAVTTTVAGDIGFAITAGGWTTWSPSAQAGTILANTDDGADGGGEQYLLVAGTGSQTLSWTFATSDDWGAVAAFFKEVSFVPAQASFRVYNDDGSESTATTAAAQDTNYTADVSTGNVNLALRFRVQETGGFAGATTDDYQLMVSKNSASYTTLPTILTSYAESHVNNPIGIFGSDGKTGQCFTPGATWSVAAAVVYLAKLGAPTGNVSLEIWGVDGAHKPTGSVLGTSSTVSIASLGTSQQLQQFTFSTPVALTSGVEYALIVVYTGGDASNKLTIGYDSAGTYGSVAPFLLSGVWTIDAADDMAFYVLDSGAGTMPFDSTNLTHGAATTNRLTGGTGSFVAGEICESINVTDFQLTANNFTELLFTVQLVSVNLANNDTLDFRVYLNGSVFSTYTVTPRLTITKVVNIYNKIVSINQSINRSSYW